MNDEIKRKGEKRNEGKRGKAERRREENNFFYLVFVKTF